jgi:hypothetical protein
MGEKDLHLVYTSEGRSEKEMRREERKTGCLPRREKVKGNG